MSCVVLLGVSSGSYAEAQERPRATQLEFLADRVCVVVDGDTLDFSAGAAFFRCEGLDLLHSRDSIADGETLRFARARALRIEVSLEPGTYDAEAVVLGLPGTTTPMQIWSFGTPLVTDLDVPDNAVREVYFSFEIAPEDADVGVLVFKPVAGDRVSLHSLRIRPSDGSSNHASTTDAEPERTESIKAGSPEQHSSANGDDVADIDPSTMRAQLRRIGDYLLTYQVPGFNGFDYSSTAWWEVSMSVRTLLAASRILEEDKYQVAATRAMEAFLASQREDGGFCAYLEGMQDPTAVTRKPRTCDTRNRADVGSITACLSLMALALPEAERAPYLEAHKRYLDTQIYGKGFPDGSYPNGLFEGREYDSAYSVATGTTALSLSTYYAATGDERALQAAEDAARFLAGSFEESGSVLFRYHDRPEPELIPATWHHNVYYMLEGMLAVHRVTEDPALRGEIEATCRRYLHGPEGIASVLPTDQWITVGTRRNLSKANGMLAVLIEIRELLGSEPVLDQWIAAGASALGDPASCSKYAVLLPPYRASSEKTSICTAFAGLSMAAAIEPDILFPSREARP